RPNAAGRDDEPASAGSVGKPGDCDAAAQWRKAFRHRGILHARLKRLRAHATRFEGRVPASAGAARASGAVFARGWQPHPQGLRHFSKATASRALAAGNAALASLPRALYRSTGLLVVGAAGGFLSQADRAL